MNKPNNLYWIGYYFNQNCIIHPDTGRWTLTGYFDGQVVCHRLSNPLTEVKIPDEDEILPEEEMPEEDCLMCPISEVSFILKFANPWLIKSLSKLPLFHSWLHNKALDGYWVFESNEINVVFEE